MTTQYRKTIALRWPKIDLQIAGKNSRMNLTLPGLRLELPHSHTNTDRYLTTLMERGMNFVTITDIHSLAGGLQMEQLDPRHAFTGLSLQALFPETSTPVTVLIWGIDTNQLKNIYERRRNLYELSLYLREHHIAHAAGLPFTTPGSVLDQQQLDLILLLFDNHVTRSGIAAPHINQTWDRIVLAMDREKLRVMTQQYLQSTPEFSSVYQQKENLIIPDDASLPVRGRLGVSDARHDQFAGTTYSQVPPADTAHDVIRHLQDRQVVPGGHIGNYARVPVEWILNLLQQIPDDHIWNSIQMLRDSLLHENTAMNMIKLGMLCIKPNRTSRQQILLNLIQANYQLEDPNERIANVVRGLASLFDDMIKKLFDPDKKISYAEFIDQLHSAKYASFSAPLYLTLQQQYRNRQAMLQTARRHIPDEQNRQKRISWYIDSINATNGPSLAVMQLTHLANQLHHDLKLISSLPEGTPLRETHTEGVHIIPSNGTFSAKNYQQITLDFPSFIHILEEMMQRQPDEVYISTPGPVGLCALLASKLLGIPTKGIFHTDFTLMAKSVYSDKDLVGNIDQAVALFYRLHDQTLAPSDEYVAVLKGQLMANAFNDTKGIGPQHSPRISAALRDMHILDEEFCLKVDIEKRQWRNLLNATYGPVTGNEIYYVLKGIQDAAKYRREDTLRWYRGLDLERFQFDPQAREKLNRLGIQLPSEDTIIILATGRLSAEKNIQLLSDVIPEINRRHPDKKIQLLIAGDGPYRAELENAFAPLPNVSFLGDVPQTTINLLNSVAHFAVFPSPFDTFGMAVLEQQAAHLPVLVSDRGGPQSIIENGKTGLVVPTSQAPWHMTPAEQKPYYQAQWTDAISEMIDRIQDPGQPDDSAINPDYVEMRHASRARVESHFDWRKLLDDMFRIKS